MEPHPSGECSRLDTSFRDIPFKWYDGLLGVGFLLPWRFLLLLPREWLQQLAQQPRWVLWVTIYLIPVAWRLLFPLGLAYRRQAGFRVTFPGWRDWVRESLVAIAVLASCLGLVLAVLIPWMLISGDGTSIPSVWDDTGAGTQGLNAFLLLSAMTVAPVTEEVFFRGLVHNCLRRYLPLTAAVVIQAGIFASLHPFDIFHLIIVFLFGVVLGGVYEWRQTLLTPILIHAVKNTVAALAVVILGHM